MVKTFLRIAATLAGVASICLSTLPASADGIENVYQQVVLPNANDAIRSALDAQNKKEEEHRRQAATASVVPKGAVAQVPPVAQQDVGKHKIFEPGFGYSAAITTAYPYGNIGNLGRQGWLMGGVDASLEYSPQTTTRIVASMFQLQHWPYGFNSGLAPIYVAGFKNPVGCADLAGSDICGPGTGQNLNVRTKDTFGVFALLQVFFIKGLPNNRVLPVVITPSYVARSGIIGESVNNNDVVPFAYNPPDGPYFSNLPTRTAQFKVVAVTVPFLKTSKMLGTFTVAAQWLMHTNGVNSTNHIQTPQVLYLEYSPSRDTRVWFEPQSARDYLPTDPYPEHLVAYFLGVSQRFAKYGFVQLVLNSGNPTNLGPDGVTAIKCLSISPQQCGPVVGGLKATQLQLQFGIGSPKFFPL
jgi:hypothetical protein